MGSEEAKFQKDRAGKNGKPQPSPLLHDGPGLCLFLSHFTTAGDLKPPAGEQMGRSLLSCLLA